MKKNFVGLLGCCVLLGSTGVNADPEEDRLKLISHFKVAYPEIKPGEYIYGSLAFDPDAKLKYDIVMQSPPHADELGKGEQLWKKPLKSGRTYAECLPDAGKNIVGNYPLFDEAQGKVVTLEDAINACRVANGELAYAYADPQTIGLLTAYLRTLSDGGKMNIKVASAAARAAYEDGKKSFYSRVGQLNFSCANCHVDNAGNRMRSKLLSAAIGQSTHWPIFRGGKQWVTLQKQYEICHRNMLQVSDKPGSRRYNNLEYFHSFISNGLPLQSSVVRE